MMDYSQRNQLKQLKSVLEQPLSNDGELGNHFSIVFYRGISDRLSDVFSNINSDRIATTVRCNVTAFLETEEDFKIASELGWVFGDCIIKLMDEVCHQSPDVEVARNVAKSMHIEL